MKHYPDGRIYEVLLTPNDIQIRKFTELFDKMKLTVVDIIPIIDTYKVPTYIRAYLIASYTK